MLNLAVNATRLCTAAGEWEGRTDYSACITAGQQEMLCISEMDASDISLYIYLVGEQPRAFCLLPVIVVTLLDFYDKNQKLLDFFAVRSSISVYLGFRFSLPSAIIFPFLPHSSKIHPPSQLNFFHFFLGVYGITNQQQHSKK